MTPTANSSAHDVQRMMLYDAQKKSAGLAYALWFFLGMLGAIGFTSGRSRPASPC